MTQPPAQSQYDRWAATYDRRWRGYTATTHAALLHDLDLSGVHDLVDVGCGTGTLLLRLCRRHPALRITGVDPSSGMLATARRRLRGYPVTLRQGTATGLPLAAATVDVVTLANVLHYLSDPAAALGEARRVLRPQGRLAVVDYVPRGPMPHLADRLIRRYDRGHQHSYDTVALCRLLDRCGFDVLHAGGFYVNPLLRGVVAVAAARTSDAP